MTLVLLEMQELLPRAKALTALNMERESGIRCQDSLTVYPVHGLCRTFISMGSSLMLRMFLRSHIPTPCQNKANGIWIVILQLTLDPNMRILLRSFFTVTLNPAYVA
ncbi:hypothetical protein EMPG_17444 [Blastomyces silverae]|uniref:Uncharacterized protein n=1 Tax=Blastomyces silverae TaxID=2060906 RepID=A0A0H1B7K4_9EURO|nr:hypothetical protein EMPG_17444 [Blastomyces silverae]